MSNLWRATVAWDRIKTREAIMAGKNPRTVGDSHATLEHRVKLLAEALAGMLVAVGMIRPDCGLTGPEALMAAEQFIAHAKTKKPRDVVHLTGKVKVATRRKGPIAWVAYCGSKGAGFVEDSPRKVDCVDCLRKLYYATRRR